MTDIDSLSASAYTNGTSPIDRAIRLAAMHIDLSTEIISGRATDPKSFPTWGNRPLTPEATAGRIVAALLDAGWSPPTDEQIRNRVAQVTANRRQLLAELDAGQTPADMVETLGYQPSADELHRMADSLRTRIPPAEPTAEVAVAEWLSKPTSA